MIDERRYTLVEVAGILHMSRRWVQKQIHLGSLPAERYGLVWRVPASALQEFMEKRTWTAPSPSQGAPQ